MFRFDRLPKAAVARGPATSEDGIDGEPALRWRCMTAPNCRDLHCIVYTSRARAPWQRADLEALGIAANARNSAVGITGRLLHAQGIFVQTLEGPATEVAALFKAIAADPRHADVTPLVNAPLAARAYPLWAMDILAADDPDPGGGDPVETAGPPRGGDDEVSSEIAHLLSRAGRPFAEINMRALPIQPRSQLTVERILVAGRRILVARPQNLPSLQAVAEAANVRLGALYRYFSSPDDLVRILVRLWIVGLFNRYRARLADRHFASVSDVADDMLASVERVLANDFFEPGVSFKVKLKIMRDYHQIPYAELFSLASDIRAAMARGGLSTRDPQGQERLAMAFAAASAFTKMTAMHAPQMQQTPYFRETLRGLFLAAMATDAGADPDPRESDTKSVKFNV